ncbi:MAG: DUF4199 domain-containing protein [Flavobacteriia bacterium]|nr:DUF4199 domain-containing protein [Flavobacteriia bacterium]NBX38976.1 DUF4199 domain-containing protein [Flavobacteriia bacterium]
MNRAYVFAIFMALLWMGVKYFSWVMGIFTFGSSGPYVLVNMFLLTVTVAIGLYLLKRQELNPGNLLMDIKKGVSCGMIYTLLVSGFIYIFYAKIHPEYNQYQLRKSAELLAKPENIEKIRAKNAELKSKSDQEIRGLLRQQDEMIYSANFTFVLSLLGLTLYSIFNSIFIALIFRRVLFRAR